ncbi:MAG: nitroreductase family protein [Candidatus Acidiferrales bacterium]
MTVKANPASTTSPVHDLIRHRWSPRAFDPRPVEPEKLRSLFEAARWAASSFNAQPWFFIVGTRADPKTYQLILDSFIEFNQGWAKGAPVVALSVAGLNFANDAKPNRHAFHDVGQAAANLAIEATAQGLAIHQMAGIDPEKARVNFAIPEGYEAVAGIAIGYPGDPESLSEALRERENAPRERKPLESFVFSGKWGEPSRIVAPGK